MKRILVLIITCLLLFACKYETNKKNEDNNQKLADTLTTSQINYDLSESQIVVNPETGDTLYLDFDLQLEKDVQVKKYQKYYIVSSYSSYTRDEKLDKELARWNKLESKAKLEEVKFGQASKYYISLGKYDSRTEVMDKFEEYKLKYPGERINIQTISQ